MSDIQAPQNRILVNQRVHNDYVVRIARDITEIDDFSDELQLLMFATEDDTIRFEVTTRGGELDTAHILVRAMRATKARTKAYIGPTCASAGTVIALACDEWEIDEMSSFMIHAGSYGAIGKQQEVRSKVEHNDKILDRFVRNTYTGFLTEDEMDRVIDGKDYYFDGDELAERLTAFGEYRARVEQAIDIELEQD